MDFAKKLKPKSQKVLIQTEELRRSDSLWDEFHPVSPDFQVYLQKYVKPCKSTAEHVLSRRLIYRKTLGKTVTLLMSESPDSVHGADPIIGKLT